MSMAGNTLAGTGTDIRLDQSGPGAINVVQADSATLSAVNGGATVSETGTINYGQGCITGGGPFGTPPVALDDAAMVDEDMTVSINVIDGSAGGLDSDMDMGDIISLRGIMTPPTMGTATITSPTNVLYDYTGPFLGLGNSIMDTFVYEITDKAGNIAMAQVTVTVNGVAVPPNTAIGDIYQTAGNTLLQVATAPTASGQDFLFGRPGAYTIADYRLRCNGFRTAARFGTPFAAAPAFECWPIMAFQRSQRAL